MATVRELRRKPIGDLTVEGLRVLIGQNVGLACLLPLAVEILGGNPFAEGDMYEGDLLAGVLARHEEVWAAFPELRLELRAVVSDMADVPTPIKHDVEGFLAK